MGRYGSADVEREPRRDHVCRPRGRHAGPVREAGGDHRAVEEGRLGEIYAAQAHKLGDRPDGNMTGAWDPAPYTVEDSAFGSVRFVNAASLYVESSWALNVAHSREACATLCGTEGGADAVQVTGSPDLKVTLNNVQGGQLVTTSPGVGARVFSPGQPSLSGMAGGVHQALTISYT